MTCKKHQLMRARAIKLRKAGFSRAQIAKELGLSGQGSVTHYLRGTPPHPKHDRKKTPPEYREKATAMRLEGRAYSEIQAALGIPKSTLSDWLKDVPISEEQRTLLSQRSVGGDVRRATALRARRVATQARIMSAAAKEIDVLDPHALLIAGVIAYWSEGSKSKPWNRNERVVFSNSDSGLVRFFLEWLAMLGVGPDDCTFRVQIHESADVPGAIRYWAAIVGVEESSFLRTTLKRHNPRTVRQNTGDSYRGCLRIEVRRSTDLYRQIAGWYQGIVNSLGRRPTGRPPGFDPGNRRSNRCAPARNQLTVFEPPAAYQWWAS